MKGKKKCVITEKMVMVFSATFNNSYIVTVSFMGGGNR
jgi:hypothetical protein